MVGGRQMDRVSLDARGAPQIFVAGADGSNPRKVTGVPEGVGEFIWSPDGKTFAFTTDVYPECGNLNCVIARRGRRRARSKPSSPTACSIATGIRSSAASSRPVRRFPSEGGEPKDLTPGDYDVPPFSHQAIRPASISRPIRAKSVFARNTDKVEATSTNNDLFIVSVGGGEVADHRRIPGSDTRATTRQQIHRLPFAVAQRL